MEREVRCFMWAMVLAGCAFGVCIGALAGDRA